MAINYIEEIGLLIKIGIQRGYKFTRHDQYKRQVNVHSKISGTKPVKVKNIWFKDCLNLSEALSLEFWIKEVLRPHLAHGTEWFHKTQQVLDFISKDPLETWNQLGRPHGHITRRFGLNDPPRPIFNETQMERLIIKRYRTKGAMTSNKCRRLIHPERIKPNGISAFQNAHLNLIETGKLEVCGKTQRSNIYRLKS